MFFLVKPSENPSPRSWQVCAGGPDSRQSRPPVSPATAASHDSFLPLSSLRWGHVSSCSGGRKQFNSGRRQSPRYAQGDSETVGHWRDDEIQKELKMILLHLCIRFWLTPIESIFESGVNLYLNIFQSMSNKWWSSVFDPSSAAFS